MGKIKSTIVMLVLLLSSAPSLFAVGRINVLSCRGNTNVRVNSIISTLNGSPTYWQQCYPSSSATIYLTGTTTKAPVATTAGGTATTANNPVTTGLDSSGFGYVADGDYDVTYTVSGVASWTVTGLRVSSSTGVINVKNSGALGNARARVDGVAVASSTTFTSATGAFTTADTGKTVLIQGAGAAGANLTTTATFVNSTTITLAVAPSTSVNPATYYIGTDDTTNIQNAITAASAGNGYQAYHGTFVGTVPDIYFPTGIYLITGELSFASNVVQRVHSDANAIIVQANNANRIFVFTNGYHMDVHGLQFIGGKYAIDYRNANVDVSQLIVEDCVFETQANYAIFTAATVSSTATGLPYSTGTISTSAGSNSATGTGTTWSDANHSLHDLHLTASDQWYKVAEVTAGGALTLNRSAISTLNTVAYEIGDYHLSLNLIINRCQFYNVNKVLFNSADHAWVRDTWVTLIGQTTRADRNFTADSAAFRNYNGILDMQGMFGVPVMGTAGADLAASVRWVDQDAGGVYADHCRFGGEFGGMSPIWFFAPYKDAAPYQSGGRIVITHSTVYAGQTAATLSDTGVVVIRPNARAATARENIPQLFVYKHNDGHSGTPIINNFALADTNTFFGAIATPEQKFRYDIGPNETGTDEVGIAGTWNAAQSSIGFQRFTGSFSTSGSLTWGAISAQTCDASQTLTVTGAQPGDVVNLGVAAALSAFNVIYRGYVSAANTVVVKVCNPTAGGITPGSGTVTAQIIKSKWASD